MATGSNGKRGGSGKLGQGTAARARRGRLRVTRGGQTTTFGSPAPF